MPCGNKPIAMKTKETSLLQSSHSREESKAPSFFPGAAAQRSTFFPAAPVQRSTEGVIQREETAAPSPDAEEESNFDFDFEALPPSVRFSLGSWMLRADTGDAELSFTNNLMRYSLGYSYGSDISLGFRSPSDRASLLFNPHEGGMGFRYGHDRFNLGFNANPFASSVGLSLGYGNSLLPMPSALSESVYGGVGGLHNALGGIPGMEDPFSYYSTHSDDIDAIMGTVRSLRGVHGAQSGFGAGLRMNYNPTTGVLVHGGLQWLF